MGPHLNHLFYLGEGSDPSIIELFQKFWVAANRLLARGDVVAVFLSHIENVMANREIDSSSFYPRFWDLLIARIGQMSEAAQMRAFRRTSALFDALLIPAYGHRYRFHMRGYPQQLIDLHNRLSSYEDRFTFGRGIVSSGDSNSQNDLSFDEDRFGGEPGNFDPNAGPSLSLLGNPVFVTTTLNQPHASSFEAAFFNHSLDTDFRFPTINQAELENLGRLPENLIFVRQQPVRSPNYLVGLAALTLGGLADVVTAPGMFLFNRLGRALPRAGERRRADYFPFARLGLDRFREGEARSVGSYFSHRNHRGAMAADSDRPGTPDSALNEHNESGRLSPVSQGNAPGVWEVDADTIWADQRGDQEDQDDIEVSPSEADSFEAPPSRNSPV